MRVKIIMIGVLGAQAMYIHKLKRDCQKSVWRHKSTEMLYRRLLRECEMRR